MIAFTPTVRRLLAVVLMVILTVLAVILIFGPDIWPGPAMIGLSETHGIHPQDLMVFVLWLLGVGTAGLLGWGAELAEPAGVPPEAGTAGEESSPAAPTN